MTAEKYVMFWTGIFSQWYPCEFEENKITFVNAEQYMMYHKAVLFQDEDTSRDILRSKSPRTIKMLGRKVRNFDEKVWKKHREEIVEQGNYLKFSQNPGLRKILLSYPIGVNFVEASPKDRIWGIGYGEKDALENKSNWGLNLLGKIIKKVHLRIATQD